MHEERLRKNIAELREYTAKHDALLQAHHFLYDLRHPRDARPEFLVLGVNPGETARDWETAPAPTEETSEHDFHTASGSGRSSIRWANAAAYFLDGAPYVLSELFFWSSSDSRQFEERFGPIAESPHLPICTRMNRDLLSAYTPRAVVLPGLGMASLAQALFDLEYRRPFRDGDIRLAEVFTDSVRPWIVTKHWTAGFGFSRAQKAAIKGLIQRETGSAATAAISE